MATSGFGTFALQAGALKVGALVAVNALGDIYGPEDWLTSGTLATPVSNPISRSSRYR